MLLLQVRWQQTYDTPILNITIKHFKSPGKTFYININIFYIMPAFMGLGCAAALKKKFIIMIAG